MENFLKKEVGLTVKSPEVKVRRSFGNGGRLVSSQPYSSVIFQQGAGKDAVS